MASLSSEPYYGPIKLRSRKRQIIGSSDLVYEFVPPKNPQQLYEEFIKSVELKFGIHSKKTSALLKLIQDCKELRITVREIESRTDKLFKDHPKFSTNFGNTLLPHLYPVSTWDEVEKANQFIHDVESAFPEDGKRCKAVEILIRKFQDGRLSLKDMSVKMLKVLENRDELIEAYIRFVPQAEHVIANITSTRRFNLYLILLSVIVAFGIGFYTMNK